MQKMEYYVRGKGKIALSPMDFIFQGGEGKIYGKGDTIYKIYENRNTLIPEAKFAELNAIAHRHVICPQEILLDRKDRYVGFTMQWVKETVPLSKLFSSGFQQKNNLTPETITRLVESIQEMIQWVHAAGCLVVDGNEFNYLVAQKGYQDAYLIDVNSFQTPSFPATAIMPSIRDPQSDVFTQMTDWFSFAIIACQLFLGIHPYKGNHPSYKRKTYGANLLTERMRAHVSVFNPEVTLPHSARGFDTIPAHYHDWLFEVLEKGNRCPPPLTAGKISIIHKASSLKPMDGDFIIRRLQKLDDTILEYQIIQGNEVIRTVKGLIYNRQAICEDPHARILFTSKNNIPVIAWIKNDRVVFHSPQHNVYFTPLACESLLTRDNRLLVKHQGHLTELDIRETAKGAIQVAVATIFEIMPLASEIYTGVMIQYVLGKPYVMIPVNAAGRKIMIQQYLKELTGFRILDAHYEQQVLMVIFANANQYTKLIFTFNETFDRYRVRQIEGIDTLDINFTVLDNGVVIAISEDHQIEMFTNAINDQRIKKIEHKTLNTQMRLCHNGITAYFYTGSHLYSLRMKNHQPHP